MKIKHLTPLILAFFTLGKVQAQKLRTIEKAIARKIDDSIQIIKKEQLQQPFFSIQSVTSLTGPPQNSQNDNVLYNETIRNLQQQKPLLIRNAELDDLLGSNDDQLLVTPTDYDNIVKTKFRTLSGTEIKSGKYMGSSITVDTKSATVNISLKPFKNSEFYLLPTIAGSSNNGFVNVLTGDKYSRTVTGGMNFIILGPNNKSMYGSQTRLQLHNDLKLLRRTYNLQPNADVTYYQNALKEVQRTLAQSGVFIVSYYTAKVDLSASNDHFTDLDAYKKNIDTLIKLKLLPKTFSQQSLADQKKILGQITPSTITNVALTNYLDKADKLQMKASFNENTISWLGGGLKYNQANYEVADGTIAALQRSVMDEYISANLSYTWMWLWSSGNHTYFSPTLNYQNNHNFNTTNQLHVEVLQDYQIGSTTTQKVAKDLTLYPNVPGRLATNYIDLPFAYYNVKWGVGFELDGKYGYNDSNNDNRDVSLGVLIPINQSASNVLVVEPLAKAQKLNQTVTNFWQNNFVLGINVSVSIPKSFFN